MSNHRMRLVFLTVLGVQGCAWNNVTVDLGLPEAPPVAAALGTARPLQIEVGPVSDLRPEPGRIGVKRNLRGHETASIHSGAELGEIFREALGAVLGGAGHVVIAEKPQLRIQGALETFWVQPHMGAFVLEIFGSIDVSADVKLALEVIELRNGGSLGAFTYYGRATDSDFMTVFDGTYKGVARGVFVEVMGKVGADEELGALLRDYCQRRVKGCRGGS